MIPPPEDFETIEAAVMSTARGRWFLREYARRLRSEETREIVEAIARLEQHLAQNETVHQQGQSRFDVLLGGLAALLASLRPAGAAMPPPAAPSAPLEGRLRALAQLDNLSAEEKLRLFG